MYIYSGPSYKLGICKGVEGAEPLAQGVSLLLYTEGGVQHPN